MAEAARTAERDAVARRLAPATPVAPGPTANGSRPHSRVVHRAARRASENASLVKIIPMLAVIVVTVAGIYIAWQKGSAGGGEGGVVGGAALLTAALARLLLPAQLVGLLGTRKRALDVITLSVFGACLLVAGLVLPN